jgi:hypothetical protein
MRVTRDTAAMPPYPAALASAAAKSRRCRSSTCGNIAALGFWRESSLIIPKNYDAPRRHGIPLPMLSSQTRFSYCLTGPKRSYRELIRTGAVRTITEHRGWGLVRLCDATVFKRCAMIAALRGRLELGSSWADCTRAAFPLLLYETCDPLQILLESWAHVDPRSGLPSRVECPRVDWFGFAPNNSPRLRRKITHETGMALSPLQTSRLIHSD